MHEPCLAFTGTALLRIFFDHAEDCAWAHRCRLCAADALNYRAELERRGVHVKLRKTTNAIWHATDGSK